MHVMDLKKKLNLHLQALRFYIEPDSKWNNLYEFVHLIMIIYSLFAIPIYVSPLILYLVNKYSGML